jgi:hypothetical protein
MTLAACEERGEGFVSFPPIFIETKYSWIDLQSACIADVSVTWCLILQNRNNIFQK